MTRILILLASLFLVGESFALPPCPTGVLHDCFTTLELDGNKYVGEFKNRLPNGQGTITFASGSKYVGEFKDGKKHGQGTYTYADGRETLGEWNFGEPWNAVMYDASGKFSHSYKDGVPQ